MTRFRPRHIALAALASLAVLGGCGDSGSAEDALTVYSGREEEIVAPLFPKFTEATGIEVEVRYGKSAELAAQIDEEGDNSPADVFFSQDAGALGSIASRLTPLPTATLERVPEAYRAGDGAWTGVSGRVRVVVYNTGRFASAGALPNDIFAYADEKYAPRLGIAPTNASFQAFVSAMRITYGDARTRTWLADLKQNGAKIYDANRPIVEAVAGGEIDLGLVNHYYLAQVKAEQPDAAIANKYLSPGTPGSLVNIAGVGIVKASKNADAAQKFVDFLLTDDGQRFYATEAEENEYPLVAGIPPAAGLPSLASLTGQSVPLADLGKEEKATLEMLSEVGLTS